jgi:uncharacterized protein YqjF (DUF2071 family)
MALARKLLESLGPVMKQTWNDLLFAHWALPPSELRHRLPRGLTLDTHQGLAWVGITPFVLSGLRLKGLPALPGLSTFPELNLRTYVTRRGRPGVWFFSLDAGRAWAVAGARLAFFLPYFKARMEVERRDGAIRFRSRRGGAVFAADYAPEGPAFPAEPGSLEHFLVERYRLYATAPGGALTRVEIRHPPWILRRARAAISRNTIAEAAGIRLPDEPPLLHYSEGVRVDVGAPLPV